MIGKLFVFSAIVFLLSSCCDQKDPVSTLQEEVQEVILIGSRNVFFSSEEPASIQEASIQGDKLSLKVSYSGGGEKHDFTLFASEGFLESSPVQAELFLFHDAHGDSCEALITEELLFDLSPLKKLYKSMYQDDGPILLRIYEPGETDSFKVLIIYEF